VPSTGFAAVTSRPYITQPEAKRTARTRTRLGASRASRRPNDRRGRAYSHTRDTLRRRGEGGRELSFLEVRKSRGSCVAFIIGNAVCPVARLRDISERPRAKQLGLFIRG